MKFKYLYCLIIFFVLLSFSACSMSVPKELNRSVEDTKSDSLHADSKERTVIINENYWQLACKNTNIVFYKNLSGSQGIEFELVTSFPFEADELTIEVDCSDSNISYSMDCYQNIQEEDDLFPFYIYQSYQGIDWKYIGEFAEKLDENGDMTIEKAQEFEKLQNMYIDEYQTELEQGGLPRLYKYTIGINFDLNKLNTVEHINAIILTLRGETKRFDFDHFTLDAEKEFEFENIGISNTFGIYDAPINISNDGLIDLTYIDLQSQEPFTLTGVSIYGEDLLDIMECSVIITQKDGAVTEMKWDGKTPMQILRDETARINIICKDPQLAGVLEAMTTKYIMIHYLSSDNKECAEVVQGIYRMRQGLYDLYAESEGINILSYYLNYNIFNSKLIQVE